LWLVREPSKKRYILGGKGRCRGGGGANPVSAKKMQVIVGKKNKKCLEFSETQEYAKKFCRNLIFFKGISAKTTKYFFRYAYLEIMKIQLSIFPSQHSYYKIIRFRPFSFQKLILLYIHEEKITFLLICPLRHS